MKSLIIAAMFVVLAGCAGEGALMAEHPDFDAALDRHLAAIADRDLDAFKASVTDNPTLYTIVQNGCAFTTPAETVALHEDWFKRDGWSWKGEVIHKIVGEDIGVAVIKYDYQDSPGAKPFSTWLTFVFKIEDGEWRLVHDQNTMISEETKGSM
ncbi:MAG: YybH family protein [Pseudomonadota bacterium]